MFSKKTEVTRTMNFDVIIGEQSSFDGNLSSEGSVRIDGKTKGDIQSKGDVIVGQNADVIGNIISENTEISGQLVGNITSTGCLKIYATGRLFGDIEVTSFIIEEGGVFEGNCKINREDIKPSDRNKLDVISSKSSATNTDKRLQSSDSKSVKAKESKHSSSSKKDDQPLSKQNHKNRDKDHTDTHQAKLKAAK